MACTRRPLSAAGAGIAKSSLYVVVNQLLQRVVDDTETADNDLARAVGLTGSGARLSGQRCHQ